MIQNLHSTAIGHGLRPEQRLATKAALSRIWAQEQLQGSHSNLTLWGLVRGIHKDYIIATASSMGEVAVSHNYYYSNDDGVTFASLSMDCIEDAVSSIAPELVDIFTGNPATKYADPNDKRYNEDGETEDEEADETLQQGEEEDGEQHVPKRKITELQRLAWTVRQITNDTNIIPRGFLLKTLTGIKQNLTYSGLSIDEAQQLGSYQYLRPNAQAENTPAVKTASIVNTPDFLDTLEQPKGSIKLWTLQVDDIGNVSLRNLLWPGYEFKTECGNPAFSGVYVGYGHRNNDLPFML